MDMAHHRRDPDYRWCRGPWPRDSPSAEVFRWVGIVAAGLAAISAIFVMPYYPVWSLIYIALAVMVIYGLSAHYREAAA